MNKLNKLIIDLGNRINNQLVAVQNSLLTIEMSMHDWAERNPPVSVFFGEEKNPDHQYNHVHKWVQNTCVVREGTARLCTADDPNWRCDLVEINVGGVFGNKWDYYYVIDQVRDGVVATKEAFLEAYHIDRKANPHHDVVWRNSVLDDMGDFIGNLFNIPKGVGAR